MSPEVQAFATGFPTALLQAGISVLLLVAGSTIYALLTPYKEIQQIREGNAAAAVSYGGVMLGLAAPLAFSLAAATSLIEIAIWGAAVTTVQLLIFRLVDMILTGLPQRAQEGEVAAAVLLVAAKLAVALIFCAAVAG
jgi:putative membrane protein